MKAALSNGAMSLATATLESDRRFKDWESFVKVVTKAANRKRIAAARKRAGSQLLWLLDRPASNASQEIAESHISQSNRSLKKIAKTLRGQRSIKPGDATWLSVFQELAKAAPQATETARIGCALAWVMPQLAEQVEEEAWWKTLRSLIALADVGQPSDETHVVFRQIAAVELGLALAVNLAPVPACHAMGRPACELLIVELEARLDHDGWPRAALLPEVPQLLATWTRSRQLIRCLKLSMKENVQSSWEWFVRQALRLMRRDGSWMLSPSPNAGWRELVAAAQAECQDPMERNMARIITGEKPYPKSGVAEDRTEIWSEWAGSGVLQSSWKPGSPRVAVTCQDNALRLELAAQQGLMELVEFPVVSLNGRTLEAKGSWENTCDHTDEDVDYLEFQIELAEDVTLQRQLLLAKEHQFFFFADVILTPREERIDYCQPFSLLKDINILEESETHEVYLRHKLAIQGLILPLAFPEWRASRTDNRLEVEDGRLLFSQSAMRQNLYAGLFIDLSPKRSCKPRTWRQLTVAQTLEKVSTDHAVAWRAQVGKDQFVIYRSLSECANRSFLGQNFSGEFMVGKFKKDGNVSELMLIETA